VPHPFTAKWIYHAGRITDRDEVSRQSIVSQRSRHQAVSPIDIPAQTIFLDEEAGIRAAALNRHRTAVSIIEEPEVQHRTLRPSLNVLNSELVHTPAFRKPAQLSRCIDHNRTFHSVHVKHAAITLYLVNWASLFHASTACHQRVQCAARHTQAGPLKQNFDFNRCNANARRGYLNSSGFSNLIRKTKLLETVDRARGEKPATHLWPRKPLTFQRYCINAHPLQFPHTGRARKTSTDDDHIVHSHFSATNTRRKGKLRYTRAGTPARSATCNNSRGRNERRTDTGPSCLTIVLLLNAAARARIDQYATG